MEDGADEEKLTRFLTGWWVALEGRDASLERKIEQALKALTRLMVDVDASLQGSQRSFLFWRLDKYIEQIEELVESRGS